MIILNCAWEYLASLQCNYSYMGLCCALSSHLVWLRHSRQLLTFLCSFHNKLKTNPKYLNHHVNRRCDDLIAILLSFEEDMYHDRKYSDIMTSPNSLSLKHNGIDCHNKAIGLLDDDIKVKLQLLHRLYHIQV